MTPKDLSHSPIYCCLHRCQDRQCFDQPAIPPWFTSFTKRSFALIRVYSRRGRGEQRDIVRPAHGYLRSMLRPVPSRQPRHVPLSNYRAQVDNRPWVTVISAHHGLASEARSTAFSAFATLFALIRSLSRRRLGGGGCIRGYPDLHSSAVKVFSFAVLQRSAGRTIVRGKP
jgi:hypothetical protein